MYEAIRRTNFFTYSISSVNLYGVIDTGKRDQFAASFKVYAGAYKCMCMVVSSLCLPFLLVTFWLYFYENKLYL